MAEDGVIILVVLLSAMTLSIPGGLALLRSYGVSGSETALEKRVLELEKTVAALQGELFAVRTDRDRLLTDVKEERIRSASLNSELLRLQARLTELEGLTAAYRMLQQQVLQIPVSPPPAPLPSAREVSPPAHTRSSSAQLERQLAELRQQLTILEVQITAAGGDEKADATKIRDRDKLLQTIRGIEGELDTIYHESQK